MDWAFCDIELLYLIYILHDAIKADCVVQLRVVRFLTFEFDFFFRVGVR